MEPTAKRYNSHKCVICHKRKEIAPHLVFHRFPKDKARSLRWTNMIQNQELSKKTSETLSRSYRVCSRHFSSKNYSYLRKLSNTAYPDQHLEGPTSSTKSDVDHNVQTELINGSVESKVADSSDSPSPNQEKNGMATWSVEKSPNEEVESNKEIVGNRTPAKYEAFSLSDTTRDSPPPKRKKTLDKQEEINFIDLSGNNDDDSIQDDDDDSSSGDPLELETEIKTTIHEKPKVLDTSVVQRDGKIKTNCSKGAGSPLINKKTVAMGGNEKEINVPSSHGANCSPGKTSQSGEAIPESAKKYMILDKATIKVMMKQGLVQTIKKDGTNQTIATYRAVIPKGESSILNKLASASVSSLPTVCNTKPASSNFVSSATTTNSSDKVFVPSSSVKIHIPPATLANEKASSVQQVSTSLRYVKTPVTSSDGKQTNMQLVTLPPEILQKQQTMQKNSGASNGKPICDTNQSSSVNISNDIEKEGIVKQKDGAKYGVPTGEFKVSKSMMMYKLTDMNNLTGFPAAVNTSIRWVAVPNTPAESKSAGGAPVSSSTVPLSFSISGYGGGAGKSQASISSDEVISEKLYTHKIQQLKAKQKEQLNYLRKRYSDLLQSYNKLANKYNEMKDVGTMKQILRDAKKYMKKDHILFFRNEMILSNRSNRGLRYSPKFMMMLMKYYKRSHIGYRFLKHIFTLPAARTLVTWRNKNLPLRKKKFSSGTTSSLQSGQHSDASLKSTGDDSESCIDSDREVEDFEKKRIKINFKEMDKTGVGDGE